MPVYIHVLILPAKQLPGIASAAGGPYHAGHILRQCLPHRPRRAHVSGNFTIMGLVFPDYVQVLIAGYIVVKRKLRFYPQADKRRTDNTCGKARNIQYTVSPVSAEMAKGNIEIVCDHSFWLKMKHMQAPKENASK